MRARGIPRIGASVTVVFLDGRTRGIVERAEADLRGVEVRTEDGELLTFRLSRATGRFTSEGRQSGARLLFE
jgi:hypothetical protein